VFRPLLLVPAWACQLGCCLTHFVHCIDLLAGLSEFAHVHLIRVTLFALVASLSLLGGPLSTRSDQEIQGALLGLLGLLETQGACGVCPSPLIIPCNADALKWSHPAAHPNTLRQLIGVHACSNIYSSARSVCLSVR
jgi:hypothetical protein